MEERQVYEILEKAYFGENPHEQRELEDLPNLMSGQTVAIDVGASLGQYTKRLIEIGTLSKIISVEADPLRVKRLTQLVEQWSRAGGPVVSIVPAAASDHSGTDKFFTTDSNISGSLAVLAERSDHWREIDVRYVKVDDLVSAHDNIFVKMDIEGAELHALLGMTKILSGRNNRLLIEIHSWGNPSQGASPLDVFRLLAKNGYGFRKTSAHYLFSRDGQNVSRAQALLAAYVLQAKFHMRRSPLAPAVKWLVRRRLGRANPTR